MPPKMKDLGIQDLTADEKVALAHEILDSVTQEAEDAPISDALKQEIDRRLAAHAANPSAAIPWEQVEAATWARLGK